MADPFESYGTDLRDLDRLGSIRTWVEPETTFGQENRITVGRAIRNLDAEQITGLLQRFQNVSADDHFLIHDPDGGRPRAGNILNVLRQSLGETQRKKPNLVGLAAVDDAVKRASKMIVDSGESWAHPTEIKALIDRAVGTVAADELSGPMSSRIWGLPQNSENLAWRVLKNNERSDWSRTRPIFSGGVNPAFDDFLESGVVRGTEGFRGLAYSNRGNPLPNYWSRDTGNVLLGIDEAAVRANPLYEAVDIHDNMSRAAERYFTFRPRNIMSGTGVVDKRTVSGEAPKISIRAPWLQRDVTPEPIMSLLTGAQSQADTGDYDSLVVAKELEKNAKAAARDIARVVLRDYQPPPSSEDQEYIYRNRRAGGSSRYTQTEPENMAAWLDKQNDRLSESYTIRNLLSSSDNSEVERMRELIRRAPEIIQSEIEAEKARPGMTVRGMNVARAKLALETLEKSRIPGTQENTFGQLDDAFSIAMSQEVARRINAGRNAGYNSATPDIIRLMSPSASRGFVFYHDPNPNNIVNIGLPQGNLGRSVGTEINLARYGTPFESVDVPRSRPNFEVVYDKVTPFKERSLPTHIANVRADAARARSLLPVLAKSVRNDVKAAVTFGGAAMAKASPVLVPLGIGMQAAAASGAMGDSYLDKEYGMSDPLALRPIIDAGIQIAQLDSSGMSFSERVNDPNWVERNPISSVLYGALTGNPAQAKAFFSAYVPGWNPNTSWNQEEFKKKRNRKPVDTRGMSSAFMRGKQTEER